MIGANIEYEMENQQHYNPSQHISKNNKQNKHCAKKQQCESISSAQGMLGMLILKH